MLIYITTNYWNGVKKMIDKLQRAKEALEGVRSSISMATCRIEGDVKFKDWLDIADNQAKEAIKELTAVMERLESLDELLVAMRCDVKFTDKATMSIPLYERMKAAINIIKGE